MEIRAVILRGILDKKKTVYDYYLKCEINLQTWKDTSYQFLEQLSKNLTCYGDIYCVAIICGYSLNNLNLLKIVIFISCSIYLLISMVSERTAYGGFRQRTKFFSRFFLFM